MATPETTTNVNKVVVNGTVELDLTGDTVEAGKMLAGITAHGKSGKKVTGSIATYTGSTSVTPGTSAQTLQTAGKYLNANIVIAAAQASGKRVVTGTFTPTNVSLYRRSISVTVGFEPATVIIYCPNFPSTLSSITTNSDNYTIAAAVLDQFAACACYESYDDPCHLYVGSKTPFLEATSTGFELSSTSQNGGYYVADNTYNYIAIGA